MEILDVNVSKMNEWLLERRQIPGDWGTRLRAVYAKQRSLLDELAKHADPRVSKLAENQQLSYVAATSTLEALLEIPELDKSKSFFGNFNDQLLYNWSSLLQFYQRNNLDIADSAKNLVQLSAYDIPALHKQLNSLDKQVKETYIREQSLNDSRDRSKQQFLEECAKLQIPGNRLRDELKNKLRKLPELYADVLIELKGARLNKLIEIYTDVTRVSHHSEVELPVIASLRAYELPSDLEAVKDLYGPLLALDDIQVAVEPVAEEQEWKIEMVGSGEAAAAKVEDLPLSDRKTRNSLIVELDELDSFCTAYGHFENPPRELLDKLKAGQSLIVMHEQTGAIERVAEKLDRIAQDKYTPQIAAVQKQRDLLHQSHGPTSQQLNEARVQASKLMAHLDSEVPKLFPTVSLKLVGEIRKEIKSLDAR
mmetsp:Transcript_13414/g.25242  ORF Transcript_13414/g.25242 Transcript_13414/m.25242 type:complete len:423 (-) Transcript_13414:2281-3549(-)